MPSHYDALLVLSFGGPEKPEEVLPFLENVLRGKNVPRERMLAVAEHYYHFGGISPINQQNRNLIAALQSHLDHQQIQLPIYWGNRNWHPMLADTVRKMKDDGVKNALAFVTSAYSSYSSCRQYLEDIHNAREVIGSGAPRIDKLRVFFNHPGFIKAMTDRVASAIDSVPTAERKTLEILYTAHSIPETMSAGCDYVKQLHEACRLVTEQLGEFSWQLNYQSRSGAPSQPWLEPDICDALRLVKTRGTTRHVIIAPIGFVSDHMEILFDLDTEAREICDELKLEMVRAKTVGSHPDFVAMIGDLIREKTEGVQPKVLGNLGVRLESCPANCCPSGRPSV